jgi:hypothetical protein
VLPKSEKGKAAQDKSELSNGKAICPAPLLKGPDAELRASAVFAYILVSLRPASTLIL